MFSHREAYNTLKQIINCAQEYRDAIMLLTNDVPCYYKEFQDQVPKLNVLFIVLSMLENYQYMSVMCDYHSTLLGLYRKAVYLLEDCLDGDLYTKELRRLLSRFWYVYHRSDMISY